MILVGEETVGDVFKIELHDEASNQDAAQLATALRDVEGVVETSSDTRSLTAALLLVKVVGGALADVRNRGADRPEGHRDDPRQGSHRGEDRAS